MNIYSRKLEKAIKSWKLVERLPMAGRSTKRSIYVEIVLSRSWLAMQRLAGSCGSIEFHRSRRCARRQSVNLKDYLVTFANHTAVRGMTTLHSPNWKLHNWFTYLSSVQAIPDATKYCVKTIFEMVDRGQLDPDVRLSILTNEISKR